MQTKGKFPLSFQLEIMQRFMSTAELTAFVEKYKGARQRTVGAGIGEPSEQDYQIFKLVRRVKSYGEVARQLDIDSNSVRAAVGRVAIYQK